ncbi:MAG: ABC transporter ATP-binding protein [Chloroflexi bacterium]|nr:ABC transporter ATP-binding protein [Chloroflexota bacterium]
MITNRLLRVEDLFLHYRTSMGTVRAVDGITFELGTRQALAVIGESGCGKTSLVRAILRLLPRNTAIYKGRVFINGTDVMPLNEEHFRREVRWVKISFVPQAAMNSLNPVLKIGEQVAEPLLTHGLMKREEAKERTGEVLKDVGVPEDFLLRYAFELSGGMRQRTAIAMALVTNPPLVVLDEPTSALDVLTQANILNTLKRIKQESNKSFIFISHDVAACSELADSVAVMYAGQMVEMSSSEEFYYGPLHPYSQLLLASVPRLREKKTPEFIPGQTARLIAPGVGCRFAVRCPHRFSACEQEPPVITIGNGRKVKCWIYA